MSDSRTRRDFMRLTAAGMAAVAAVPAKGAPEGDLGVRVTAGAKRFAEEQPLKWQPAAGPSADAILLDPGSTYQEVLGFGAAFTDAACYTFNQLPAAARERLFHEHVNAAPRGGDGGRGMLRMRRAKTDGLDFRLDYHFRHVGKSGDGIFFGKRIGLFRRARADRDEVGFRQIFERRRVQVADLAATDDGCS